MVTAEELHQKLGHVEIGVDTCRYHIDRCRELAPVINDILRLKAQRNAVILAHSYVSPDIVYTVADFHGDSYGLSRDAQGTDADVIVFAAVRFMAETAKILNPEKEVLVPSEPNGCTLADSITAAEVRRLRLEYPRHTFVCYINTTAEVKAECDVCVTSSNALGIVERLPNDRIFFLPDRLMGQNLRDELQKRGVRKEIALHDGMCYVHEQYDPDMIAYIRLKHPGVEVLSHPECSPGVVGDSDFVGSTSQLLDRVRRSGGKAYFLLTECGLTGRLQVEFPEKKFVGTCTQCRYMRANNLHDIRRVLRDPRPADSVEVAPDVAKRARGSIERMFEYAEN